MLWEPRLRLAMAELLSWPPLPKALLFLALGECDTCRLAMRSPPPLGP